MPYARGDAAKRGQEALTTAAEVSQESSKRSDDVIDSASVRVDETPESAPKVRVKEYTRADGTAVRGHTRRLPRQKKPQAVEVDGAPKDGETVKVRLPRLSMLESSPNFPSVRQLVEKKFGNFCIVDANVSEYGSWCVVVGAGILIILAAIWFFSWALPDVFHFEMRFGWVKPS